MSLFDEPSRQPIPDTPELEDHRAAVIKGAIGAIPILGGALAEELGLVLAPPLARRRDDWFNDLARRLHDLEGRVAGFRFEDLTNNEQFVSATVQATQTALKTRDEEKLQALRNAVLNAAIGGNFSEEQQGIFLSLVDSLQPIHLRILKFLDEPLVQANYTALSGVVGSVMSGVPGAINFGPDQIQMLLEDLRRMGLANLPTDLHQRAARRWTSDWGHDFLKFITDPGGTNGN